MSYEGRKTSSVNNRAIVAARALAQSTALVACFLACAGTVHVHGAEGGSGASLPPPYHWLNSPLCGGGGIGHIHICPNDSRIILAGGDAGGVYRTTDGGESWGASNRGLRLDSSRRVCSLLFHPSRPNVVYLATGACWGEDRRKWFGQIYVSHDAGRTWQVLTEQIKFHPITGHGRLAIHPKRPDRIYAAGFRSRVARSDDGGHTWQHLALPVKHIDICFLAILPGDSDTVFAASNGRYEPEGRGGLFRSRDGGATWQRLKAPSTITWISVSPAKPRRVVCAACGDGVWMSEDAGDTWRPINTGITCILSKNKGHTVPPWRQGIMSVAMSPVDGNVLYAAGNHAFYRSLDGGRHWEEPVPFRRDVLLKKVRRGTPPSDGWYAKWFCIGSGIASLAADPNQARTVYMGDWYFLYISHDAGETWAIKSKGLERTVVNAIRFDPNRKARVYICVQDVGFFRSDDAGATFDFNHWDGWSHTNRDLAVDGSTSPSTIYMAVGMYQPGKNGRVVISRDGGETWARSFDASQGYPGKCVYDLELTPGSPPVLWLGAKDCGLWHTADRGKTWQPMNSGLPNHATGWKIVTDCADPRHMLCSVGNQARPYRSEDGGGHWRLSDNGLPRGYHVRYLVADPVHPGTFYVGASWEKGIYRSTDGGKTWRCVFAPMNCRLLEIQARPWRIFAGGVDHWVWPARPNYGLFYSTCGDSGTLRRVPGAEQLPTNSFTSFAADPSNPNRWLLGTAENGIWIGEPTERQP